jgi:peptidoglycan glycosyltransferase
MAYFAMTLANEGHTFRPRLKRGVHDPSFETEEYNPPDSVHIQPIRSETYGLIKRGMLMVIHGDHGTARGAAVRGITMAGKTGTAQNPHGEPHAWFIGFAPFDNPQIAFCIFIENGGGGGAVAAPIAREIISLLLKENKLIASPPLAAGRKPSSHSLAALSPAPVLP